MRKSELKFIMTSIVRAQAAIFNDDKDEIDAILETIELYCQTEIDELQKQEDNDRWLEEKRIRASIGTLNQ